MCSVEALNIRLLRCVNCRWDLIEYSGWGANLDHSAYTFLNTLLTPWASCSKAD